MPKPFTLDDESQDQPTVTVPPSVAKAGDQILDAQPEVSEHAISTAQHEVQYDAHIQTPVTTINGGDNNGEKDADGVAWNPDVHATGADGKGVKTAKGTWRRRRQTKKSVTDPRARNTQATQQLMVDQQRIEHCKMAGVAMADSLLMMAESIGGSEWKPKIDPDERSIQHEAWSNYFVAKGIGDFPPGMALFMAISMYTLPRLSMPKTREKAGKAKTWLTLRIARARMQRELNKRGVVAKVEIKDGKILIDGKTEQEHAQAATPR